MTTSVFFHRICHITALSLLSLSLLTPCFARKVKTSPGEHIDFASYKTYQWLPTKALTSGGIVENEPTTTPAVKEAVNRELTARGLTEVAQGGDLQVSTIVFAEHFPQLEAVFFGNNLPFMYGQPVVTMGRYNKEGTFAINLIDGKTEKSAWLGMVTDSIDNKRGSGLKKLPGATAALFNKYPIKKK